MRVQHWFVLSLVVLFPLVGRAESLSLEDYLSQVRTGNSGVKGSIETSAGAMSRSAEKNTLFAPSLFLNARTASDSSLGNNQFYLSDKLVSNSYSLGLQQLTSFGLAGKLYYQVDYTEIVNAKSPLVAASPSFLSSYHDSKPVLELNLNLWRNGLGREMRATQNLIEAAALATSFGESFKVKMALAQAEAAYWRLALSRETVAVQRESVERASKMREWNERRVRLQLADRSDLLQTEALLQLRKLELQAALDEEAAASRNFNTVRGAEGDRVGESLIKVDAIAVDNLSVPTRATLREDVKAAQQAERISVANARIGKEKNRPTLDVFGSMAFNGRDAKLGASMSNSFDFSAPTYAAGVKFSMPLSFGSLSDAREGYSREAEGAALSLERKIYEQDRDWADLNTKLNDAKRRLQLARTMENAQKEKYEHERDRLNRGRSVTFTVLNFEQEFRSAQLSRLRAQAEILMLLANMKTYGGAQ